jgi:hypothetical protein
MARAALIALHLAAIVVGVYGGLQLFDLVTK